MAPNPYAVIGPKAAASLLLDAAARAVGAVVPEDARAGLEELIEAALEMARDGLHQDARLVLGAALTVLTRRWAQPARHAA